MIQDDKTHNKLVEISDKLYYRVKNTTCMCKDCKEDIESALEKLEEVLRWK